MSANDENFGNNPFRGLDGSRFPKRAAGNPAPPKKIAAAEIDGESAIFLRAMNERGVGAPELKSGFTLAEQCNLTSRAPRKKKRKKAIESPPETETSQNEKIDEETNAFLLATRGAAPLPAKGREIARRPATSRPPAASDPSFGDLLDASFSFAVCHSDEYMEGRVNGFDETTMNRLRMGRFSPEAHIDLHGLNAAQAFETLREFMRDSWQKGLRSVLIVHGRGRNSPDGMGVLRRKISSWLTQEPFKRVVLAFCTAQPHDGGPGSVYALLRKDRKKGPIFWEKNPADADLYH